MFVLRDYQQKAVDKGYEFFISDSERKPCMVLPTGSGKSLIVASLAKKLSGNVLVLQPSKELLEQNYRKYEAITKDNPDLPQATIYSASFNLRERGEVTFATIGSVWKKPELFAYVDNVIIDECHNVPPKKDSMYVKFLKKIDVKVLGLTATPFRKKTYQDIVTYKPYSQINLLLRERPQFFNQFIHVTQIKEMYDGGYLAPINYIEETFDGRYLEINSTGAEYTDASMQKAIEANDFLQKIPRLVQIAFEKGRKSCLVFVRSVNDARQLSEKTPFSAYVHALTKPKEREEIIKGFKNGSIKTIYNVSVLTEGFDHPELDTIILARPTMSMALYMQMIGRGMRLADGKEYCSVLDLCGNVRRFGKIEEMRLVYEGKKGWVWRNDQNILSGVRLDKLVQSSYD